MKTMKLKTIAKWLPFVMISLLLIFMGLGVGLKNMEWQVENGYTPMNTNWPLWAQYICYWVVMMFGWIAAVPFIWVVVGPHDYHPNR